MSNENAGTRALHPIGVVSARTGLTPDVIRVWERRYGVVDPERDEAGRRLYTDADVERLGLLAAGTAVGRGIGQLASLEVGELRALVRQDEAARWSRVVGGGPGAGPGAPGEAAGMAGVARRPGEVGELVARALTRVRALDGPGLEGELARGAALLGLSEFLESVVAPLFRRIGDEWHAGRLSVAQEHLASGVAGAVVAELGRSVTGGEGAPLLVVATPAGEHHEIGALLVAAAAAGEGWRVVYLGSNLPSEEIAGAARDTGASCIALSLVYGDGAGSRAAVAAVRAAAPAGVDVVVGGAASEEVGGLVGVERLGDLASLRGYLADRVRERKRG